MQAETIAERLGARRVRDGWIARCPAHEDRHPSLSIGEGADGRVLLKCHAGCTATAIVAAMDLHERDLFNHAGGGGIATGGNPLEQSNGLTLAEYVRAKHLPEGFLRDLGLAQISLSARPAVRMPYFD